jgi:hypothetical protein
MKKIAIIIACLIVFSVLASTVEARGRNGGNRWLSFGAGVLVGTVLSSPPPNRYYQPYNYAPPGGYWRNGVYYSNYAPTVVCEQPMAYPSSQPLPSTVKTTPVNCYSFPTEGERKECLRGQEEASQVQKEQNAYQAGRNGYSW